jgi:hypothetical protein
LAKHQIVSGAHPVKFADIRVDTPQRLVASSNKDSTAILIGWNFSTIVVVRVPRSAGEPY